MALLLSGRTRNTTTSSGFLSLGQAQAALGNTPSTSTGYTLISNNSQTSWVSSLGRINFTFSNAVSYIQSTIPNGDVVYRPNGLGTLYIYGPVVIPELSATAKTKATAKAATTSSISLIGGAPTTIDGVALDTGDVILVKAQSNPAQNGVYTVSYLGVGSNGTWARSPEYQTSTGLSGAMAFVTYGNKNGGYYFYTDFKPTQTINSDPVYWYQYITDSKTQNVTSKYIDSSPIGTTSPSVGYFTQGVFNTASVTSSLLVGGLARVTDSTSATSTWTGALTVAGGLGVNGAVYARAFYVDGEPLNTPLWNGGTITSPFYVANIEESFSTMTGALKVLGGAGIGGSLYVGRQIVLESRIQSGNVKFTMRNTATNGQSYTWEVGGYNAVGTAGTNIREGNLTLYSDTAGTYRLIVSKSTGNLIIGSSYDNGDKLQVSGAISFDEAQLSTRTTSGINTTATTVIDSFSKDVYRTAKYLVQIQEGSGSTAKFHVVEIVVLFDNNSNVYKSEYGIITTGGERGTFDVDYNVGGNGLVRLLFTASQTTNKTIKVLRQAISVL